MPKRAQDTSGRSIERVCMECLTEYLGRRVPDETIHFTPVAQREQPPDFWLDVGEKRFAVEVTSLVEDVRGAPSPRYWALLGHLANDVEAAARERRVLRGTYVVYAVGFPDLPTGKSRLGVVERCVDYVRETMAEGGTLKHKIVWPEYPTLQGIPVIRGAPRGVYIMKADAGGARVIAGFGGAKDEGQIEQEVHALLADRILEKRRRLDAERILQRCAGVVLVLYDAYPYASISQWSRCIAQVSGADWFHSIFLAHSVRRVQGDKGAGGPLEGIGCFLRTQDHLWAEGPAAPG